MDELAALLRANPPQVEAITNAAYKMRNAAGETVGSDFFAWYGQALAPVLRERRDLKDLTAVMRDAQAIAEARDAAIPGAIVDRFVAAKTRTDELLAALLPSPALQRRLGDQETLVARLLCLADERLQGVLPQVAAGLEALFVGKGAPQALPNALVALAGQDVVAPADLLPALVTFWQERPLPTGEELLDFAASCARQRIAGKEADYVALLRLSLPVAPAGIGNRRQWVKHLNEHPGYLRYVRPHVANEDDARFSYDALDRLFGLHLRRRDDRAAYLAVLPVVFAAVAHLIGSRHDFVTLCDSMVPILATQPRVQGAITVERVLQQVGEATTLAGFLAHCPGVPEEPKQAPITPSSMLDNPSPEFKRFDESFFGDPYMAWHDGLDTEALLALTGFERTFAEQLLLSRLESGGDTRVAVGLGVLGLTGAVEPLQRRLASEGGNGAVEVALALWRIAKDPAAAQVLLDCLAAADSYTRMQAAIALREVEGDETRQALWRALDDEDYLVRHHAAESLTRMAGTFTVADGPDHPASRIMHDDPVVRGAAKAEIGRLIGLEAPPAPPAGSPARQRASNRPPAKRS